MPSSTGMSFSASSRAASSAALSPGAAVRSASASVSSVVLLLFVLEQKVTVFASVCILCILPVPGLCPAAAVLLAVVATAPPELVPELVAPLASAAAAPPGLPAL
eukprot:1465838-Amphidinium_carterae.1